MWMDCQHKRGRHFVGQTDEEEFCYSTIFMFLITKNVAKYEALLEGLRLANKIQAKKATVYVDSQLVVW